MQKKLTAKRKMIYVAIMVIMILATIYVGYYYFLKDTLPAADSTAETEITESETDGTDETDGTEVPTIIPTSNKIEFSDGFLKKAPYINLRPATTQTINISNNGRLNPFIQNYSTSTNLTAN